ncbi:MAG: DegT/DnrJ/EryC1/StrS family aminotransferase [Caldilineaceae bacterium]|nr:DegT/DnrJ/EryC1/StrS family aminotransferase [Caldilineaceae bacterium]
MASQPIPVIDLYAQYNALKPALDEAAARVLASGWYILGKEVAAFEAEFATYLETGDWRLEAGQEKLACITVNSGTDALQLALRACAVGPGDEVITVSHTAVATVAAIRLTGATPVLVDIDAETYTMTAEAVAAALTPRTKAIIPVHLYGHPAPLAAILALGRAHHIPVIEDCAQAHGARYQGRKVGTWGDLACFSFYPTKNLGALGDGGAVVGRDPALLEKVRSLREYGWTPAARYISQREGLNSRLDEMQAALLRVKLRFLDEWNEARRRLAALYTEQLPRGIIMPVELPACHHVYHLYVVRVAKRDHFRQQMQAHGIATAIHYPAAVHQQPAYQQETIRCHALTTTEKLLPHLVTLPLYPQLTDDQAQAVCRAATKVLAA